MRPYELPTYEDLRQKKVLPHHTSLTPESTASYSSFHNEYERRQDNIRVHGFARLNVEVVEALATLCAGKKVIEAGAGLGLLSRCLHDKGIEVRAFDVNTGLYVHVWKDEEPYYPIETLDIVAVDRLDADVILLCWPCYDSMFAYQVVQRMRPGQRLIYLGEGRGGCTGDVNFFDYLETIHFQMQEPESDALNVHHWPDSGIWDRWTVYDRVL